MKRRVIAVAVALSTLTLTLTLTLVVGRAGSAPAGALVGPVASAVDVVSGPQAGSTCARFDDGTLKCWGYNVFGQLGYGDTAHRGDGAGEMGDALPAVDLGTGRTVVDAAVGDLDACAVLDDGQVKCWGWNAYGQLGLGDTANRGDGPGEMGDALPAIALGTGRTATAVAVGQGFACARLDNGAVKCWGRGNHGQLGNGSPSDVGRFAVQMGDNLAAADLGTGRTAVGLAAGNDYSCARLDDGTLKCWGGNDFGQLGLADTTSRGRFPGEMGDALPAADFGHLAPAPALTVTTTADEASVPVGSPIHLHVTLTNTGNVPLTGVTVTDANAPACAGPQADLAVGASRTVDCTYTPTVDDIGTRSNTAIGDAVEVEPVTSSTVDVSVTIPAGMGVLKGRVTALIFGNPVGGVFVAGLDPADASVVGLDTTDANGDYAMLVPAGSVWLYRADPAQGHIPGFHSTTPTVVGDGATVTVNTQLNRALGGIEGRITDAGSGSGIASGLALTTNAATGQMGVGAATDEFGFWVVRNLRSVGYLVTLLDLAGAHAPRYYNGAPTPATASTVNVVGGALQVIGTTALPAQATPGGAAHVTGSVTGSGGGGLANVAVVALNAGDFSFEAGDVTDGAGAYDIAVDPGAYLVGFADTSGGSQFEWYADQPGSGLGSATPVAASAGSPGVADAELASNRGTVSGTVTEDGTGDPLAGVWAIAIDSTGSVVAVDESAGDGTYSLAEVPVGGVRVRFFDVTGGHVPEYWDDHGGASGADGYAAATVIAVTGGATQIADAALAGGGIG